MPEGVISGTMDLIDNRTPWTGDQPCRKISTYTEQHKHRVKTFHALGKKCI